jgi:hypothetical protein
MPPKKVKPISSVDTAKKTDDDEVFNALPMPNTTTAGLLTVDLKTKYSTIYNVFKVKGMAPGTKVNTAWVGQHVNAVRNYITETYTEPNTLYGYLNWLGNILLVIDKNKYRNAARESITASKVAKFSGDSKSKKSRFNDKDRENWIHFPDLKVIRDNLATQRYADRTNKEINIAHLIFCLNTYLPPVRLDMTTAQIYPKMINESTKKPFKNHEVKSPVDQPGLTNNYYFYQHKPGQWAIYMFYERKVGNKKKEQGKDPYTIFLDKDIQYPVSGKDGQLTGQVRKVTNLEKLNEVINQSLKDYPRDFLLPNTKKLKWIP